MKKIIQKIKDLWNKAAEWIVAQYNNFYQSNFMALKIGEDQAVQMPMKTVISLIVIVALGTWAISKL